MVKHITYDAWQRCRHETDSEQQL